MLRFGQIDWQSSARLIALTPWVLALALTGGMGWQAWTAIQQTTATFRYISTEADPAMDSPLAPSNADIVANKNRVAL